MADGVDHIDIYADVGEEFNQVLVCLEQGLAQVPASMGIVGRAVGGEMCRVRGACCSEEPLYGAHCPLYLGAHWRLSVVTGRAE